MDHCCQNKEAELVSQRETHGRVLKIVLAINLGMFLVEIVAGILSGSSALKADSLDMLGDAIVYGFSLYVIGRGLRWEAKAALLKGLVMAAFGLFVVADVLYRAFAGPSPQYETMGLVGGLALIANAVCLGLLLRHRNDNLNLRSTWLCSRNDIIANCGVLLAAVLVSLTNRRWPDLVVGVAIAAIFLRTAMEVLRESLMALRSVRN